MQRLLKIITVIIFIFPLSGPAYASGEFFASYNVNYYVFDSGPTQVVQNISLTNNLTNLYAAESEITVGTTNIDNISANDGAGNLALKLSKDQDRTKIHVYFNEKVVGKGKTLNWVLRYETNDVVTKSGLIKEINVPRLELDPDISSYTLSIVAPKSWGKPAFVKPVYKDVLTFNKDELSQGQISIAFGTFQVLNYKLTYHLKNPRLKSVITEIALPPDTNYQKVFLQTLMPLPLNVTTDKDGNWLAKYMLGSQQTLDIVATGSAQLFLTPAKDISNFRTSQYLTSQKYWQTENPEIVKLAQKYKTPKEIFNFVVNKLKYNYERVKQNPQRLGALTALAKPDQAICMEFTDLFIAISRAAGIPAREVDGFAFTTNERLRPLSLKKDILHAWPEYFDGEKWIQVDPTWQNTTGGVDFFSTFDFNHFAFAIKGLDSEYPYPAGDYKIDNVETKDVEISFGNINNIPSLKNNLVLELVLPQKSLAGFTTSGKLIATNLSQNALDSQVINLSTTGTEIQPKSLPTGIIAPLGKKEFAITIGKTAWYQKNTVVINAQTANTSVSKSLEFKPLVIVYFLPFFIVISAGSGLAVLLLKRFRKI